MLINEIKRSIIFYSKSQKNKYCQWHKALFKSISRKLKATGSLKIDVLNRTVIKIDFYQQNQKTIFVQGLLKH